jgi:hypothetical protein
LTSWPVCSGELLQVLSRSSHHPHEQASSMWDKGWNIQYLCGSWYVKFPRITAILFSLISFSSMLLLLIKEDEISNH